MQHRGFQYAVYARGGSGRSAKWDWEVRGDSLSDENRQEGSVIGAERNAHQAAKDAIDGIWMGDRITIPKRPRDPNQLAKLMIDIAVGDERDGVSTPDQMKLSDAKRKGATARAHSLTPEERSEIASIAAAARWRKKD